LWRAVTSLYTPGSTVSPQLDKKYTFVSEAGKSMPFLLVSTKKNKKAFLTDQFFYAIMRDKLDLYDSLFLSLFRLSLIVLQ